MTVAIAQPTSPPRPLDELAAELQREHEAAEGAWRTAVEHALRAGQLLLEAKAQVPHGEWLPWLERNFLASARTAQGYMRLASRPCDAQRLAHLGVHRVLRELASPRRPQPLEERLKTIAAEDGPLDDARRELAPGRERPSPAPSFRSTGVWRKSWADIDAAARRAESSRQTIAQVHGLVPEALADLLDEMCNRYRALIDGAEELKGYVLEGRPRRR